MQTLFGFLDPGEPRLELFLLALFLGHHRLGCIDQEFFVAELAVHLLQAGLGLGPVPTQLGQFAVHVDKPDDAATYIFNDIEIFVPLEGLVDVDSELAKLGRDRAKVESSLKQVNGKLSNEKFLANAPEAVVAKEKGKKEELEARLVRIEEAEQRLHKIGG